MKVICIIFCLFLSGCGVMPYKLCSKVDQPTPLSEIKLTVHEESLLMSSYHCHKLAWKMNPLIMIAAIGTIPACAEVTYSKKNRKVKECEVWVPRGDKYMLEHELRHCEGYKDSLF